MNTRRIITIFLFIAILVTASIFVFQKNKKANPSFKLPEPTPSVTDQIEEKFQGLVIPDDTEKIELDNVSGGEAMGIATKNEILADLPDLEKGETYQMLISNGTKTILLGNLKQAKGGWILEYDLSKYFGYNQITVMKGRQQILKGSF